MNFSRRPVVVVLVVALIVVAVLAVSVPASAAVLPGVAAAGVAALAIYATDRREAERLKHERHMKRVEQEAQWQSRLRDERRQFYLDFLERWHSYEDARTRIPRNEEEIENADLAFQRSYNALSLIAPMEVLAAATVLFNRARAREVQNEAPARFREVARKDLNISD